MGDIALHGYVRLRRDWWMAIPRHASRIKGKGPWPQSLHALHTTPRVGVHRQQGSTPFGRQPMSKGDYKSKRRRYGADSVRRCGSHLET